ncbi:MAG: SDR family NAD(P)-dependent oxidoreductase, partial [Spirochaetota bacterium]
MDFTGKRVLITGAGAGIGKAAAVLLARSGARVAANSLSAAKGAAVLAALGDAGCEGIFIQGDVSQDKDARRMVRLAVEAFGGLDILVNCAGIVVGGRVEDAGEEDYQRVMDVNVKGTFLVSKYA